MSVFEGLQELRAALLAMPKELRDDAAVIVNDSAASTASEIRAQYERVRTPETAGGFKRNGGHLADNVHVIPDKHSGDSYAQAIVKSQSPHAHLYEYGTQSRAWKNGKSTGSMPARPTVTPAAIRARLTMQGKLVALVRAAGFEVSGV